MKWIADQDEQRIRAVLGELRVLEDSALPRRLPLERAMRDIRAVLENIHRLGQEQAHPEPRIVELSEQERRLIYPERHQ